jgi:hypothetical protein
MRKLSDKDTIERQFADEDIARHAGDVSLDMGADVAALAGLGPPVLDLVKIAVQQVDSHPVDAQPSASVDEPAPIPWLDDRPGLPSPRIASISMESR